MIEEKNENEIKIEIWNVVVDMYVRVCVCESLGILNFSGIFTEIKEWYDGNVKPSKVGLWSWVDLCEFCVWESVVCSILVLMLNELGYVRFFWCGEMLEFF